MSEHPKVENTPGLKWRRPKKNSPLWQAVWKPRSDLVGRGYHRMVHPLWTGEQPTEQNVAWMQSQCQALQNEMLAWARGSDKPGTEFDGTWGGLVRAYQTDPDSTYRSIEYATRVNYDVLCRRIIKNVGEVVLKETTTRDIKRWHTQWSASGIPMARALIKMVRVILTFGATIIEDGKADGPCFRLRSLLRMMRFKMADKRQLWINAEQAVAIRKEAHRRGFPSIALAQAIQFDLMLRQKDVIGAWVPVAERGTSDIIHADQKWLKGLRWSEIDETMTLRHETSKKRKVLQAPLMLAPMVMEELAHVPAEKRVGPIIVSEETGRPWFDYRYRDVWREIATAVGVPKDVFNMDSRAGGITEATDAGIPTEILRHAATHSDGKTTEGYSRDSAEKVRQVLERRAAYRTRKQNAS